MKKLARSDLLPLEQYAERRGDIRTEVMAHKRNRQVQLGDHVRLLFEDAITIRYQVQEMLRTERIFEAAGIQDELDAYNPLIPDGDNFKATMMIEYDDVAQRRAELVRLRLIENRVWVEVEGQERVFAVADEDLERSNEDKTASVHFLRFQLAPAAIRALRAGAALRFGIAHPAYEAAVTVSGATREALLADLD